MLSQQLQPDGPASSTVIKHNETKHNKLPTRIKAIKDAILIIASKKWVSRKQIAAALPTLRYDTRIKPRINELLSEGKLKVKGHKAVALYKKAYQQKCDIIDI